MKRREIKQKLEAQMSRLPGPVRETSYTSHPVPLLASFLAGPPAPPSPLPSLTPVRFTPELPEYKRHTAFLVSDVLTPAECEELRGLAEQASPRGWEAALIAVGPGLEVAQPSYRNSLRIIWDRQDIVDRIWGRCALAEGVEGVMGEVPWTTGITRGRRGRGRWVFRGLNERMRFLRYEPGMFFRKHCDAHYTATIDGKPVETFYTLHLYLNHEGLKGGATAFLSADSKRRVDVDPKMGSVLIFQHDGLYHEGAEVTAGTKFTMRTDVMYTWETEDDAA